jgi:hypothetical protein
MYKFEHVVRHEQETRGSGRGLREAGPRFSESRFAKTRPLPPIIDETDPAADGKRAIDLDGLNLEVEPGLRLKGPEQWFFFRRDIEAKLRKAGVKKRGTVISPHGDARLFGQLLSLCEDEALRIIMFCHSGLQAVKDLDNHFSYCYSLPDHTTATSTDDDMEDVIWVPNPNIEVATTTTDDDGMVEEVTWVPKTNIEVAIPVCSRW